MIRTRLSTATARALSATLTLGALLTLAACGTRPGPAPSAPANPQAFFQANGAPVQTQTVNVGGAPVTATFAGGTALTFGSNSLLDAGDNPYTGPVVVRVREIRSKSDMIRSNVLAVSGQDMLVSGGMFELKLSTPGGAELDVNPAVGVGARVPAVGRINDGMRQFVQKPCDPASGAVGCPPPAAGQSSVDWAPVAGQFGIDGSTNPGAYVFSVFGSGWINCDYFYSDPRPKGTIHIGFTPINDANTIVFFVPQGVSSVISLYTTDGPNRRKSYDNSLPIGLNAEVVALTFNDGKQYLAHQSIVVVDEMLTNLTFTEATDAQIRAYLDSL